MLGNKPGKTFRILIWETDLSDGSKQLVELFEFDEKFLKKQRKVAASNAAALNQEGHGKFVYTVEEEELKPGLYWR